MLGRADLPTLRVGQTQTVWFDFTGDLASGETLSSPTVSASVYSGTDANPSAILIGSPSISGARVSQKIAGGTAGVIYQVVCTASTSAGQTVRQAGYVATIPDLP